MVPETCIAGLVRLLALQSLPLFAEQAPASRLQEVLDFCNSGRTRESESARDGIAGVQTEVVMEALSVGTARCFCRGLEVAIDFDESRYPGGSVFLFASVLEHYLGLSSGLNWFTRLVARSLATRQVLHRFKSRADHEAFSSTV